MLPSHHLRACCATIPARATLSPEQLTPALLHSELARFQAAATDAQLVMLSLGAGRPVPSLRLGPAAAPTVVVIGDLAAGAAVGPWTVLSLAQALATDQELVAELGCSWWLIPWATLAIVPAPPLSADPAVALMDAVDRLWSAPPLPTAQTVLAAVQTQLAPALTTVLTTTPPGGAARLLSSPTLRPKQDQFARLLDLFGVPVDGGGAAGPLPLLIAPATYGPVPGVVLSPYQQFRQGTAERWWWSLLADQHAVQIVTVPTSVDYQRREADHSILNCSRQAAVDGAVRLWREWFAFGRTVLDQVVVPGRPVPAVAVAAYQAVAAALADEATIGATGLGWAAQEPDRTALVTVAEAFTLQTVVRCQRWGRLLALQAFLAQLQAAGDAQELSPLLAAQERVATLAEQWHDEVIAAAPWRQLSLQQQSQAYLAAILSVRVAPT